jgi:uncharacterized repeat protein (TIGR01451 family)
MCTRRAMAIVFFVVAVGVSVRSSADGNTDRALVWLNSHQSVSGTWGTSPELLARDTSRVLVTLQMFHSTASTTAGYTWLATQPLDANQLLAEQALALAAGKFDSSMPLARLAAQHSGTAPDFGGFADHNGDVYDSALALQAFATNEQLYATNISGILSTLISRQNIDGGWGIDQGFDSSPVLTAEVLIGLSILRQQSPPVATMAAAQTYLARLVHADGSIGADVLQTALSLRALALSGYVINSFSGTTLNYLRARQASDGSWSQDPYLTARILEAFAVDKPNLILRAGDFVLSPTTIADGGSVTATVIVRNTGTVVPSFTTLSIYASDARSTPIASQIAANVPIGGSETHTLTFTPASLQGSHTLVAVADAKNETDEVREDDNEATATLTVTGKPDLQVFPADITTSPVQLQPNQPGQLTITIHNNGDGDVTAAGYAVYETNGSAPETLLQQGTTGPIAVALSQTMQIPINFAGGSHLIRVIVDPGALVAESVETNNQATRTISVSNVTNVDLRVRSGTVIATPSRPNTGDTVTISAIIENTGTDPVQSRAAFFDGVPGAGGALITSQPITIDAQSSVQVQTSYVTIAASRVVYVVADPDNLMPEFDETNNSGFATLSDQTTDLVITRDSIVLPKTLPAVGQTLNARVVVRNNGLVAATNAEVLVYDDLPQNGGRTIVDQFVDVPALGSVVVTASWTVRAGQRFVTAVVNPSHALFEPTYDNNRATRLYTVNGTDTDIFLYNPTPNLANLKVDPMTLSASGFLQLDVQGSTNTKYLVTVFEDIDGDLAYNAEVDNPLGSLLVQPLQQQTIKVPVQGVVRFAPGHLMVYLDSANAVAESREDNNLIDLYHYCQHDNVRNNKPTVTKWTSTLPSVTLSPVARILDTNGDGSLDENDVPAVVIAYNGGIVLKRGDSGQTLWSVPLSASGRQISPVIADLDGDGKAEIIAHLDVDPVTGAHNQHRLVALNVADGSRKWVSPQLDRDPQWDFYIGLGTTYSYGGAPAVADLDGDGHPEVICGRTVLNGADGTIKWVGTGGSGRAWKQPDPGDPTTNLYTQFFPDQEAPIAVDLDNDGRLEVVAGNTAYRADGTILWQRADLPDGYTAPVWLGTDVNPRICLVGLGRVWLLNNDGSTRWGPVSIPNGALLGGAPTVFTIFGNIAIAVAGDGFLTSFNPTTGAVNWTRKVANDVTTFGGTTTNSATAFNQDGLTNLFYASRDQFQIIRGDNIVEYTLAISNNPYYPTSPVVADADNDGHAEVIVPGTDVVRVIGDPTWFGAPAVFNEASYHAVNVTETGAIPAHEVQDSFSRVNYRANRNLASSTIVYDPNLTVSYPRIDGNGYPANVRLTVRVGNNGWAAAPAANVAFFRLNADNTSTQLATLQTDAIASGAYQDLTYTYPNPPTQLTFYATVDPSNTIRECDDNDNRGPNATLHLSADIAVDPIQLVVSDPNPRQGDPTTFSAVAYVSGAVNTAQLNAQFFLGNPATGGTAISPMLPMTLTSNRSLITATTSFTWTVNASPGAQTIFVVFDPSNVIAEDDETNNAASVAVNVSTPDPIQKLSGTISLTPPSAEAGTPVRADIVVQNIGNVPLSNVIINYTVTGGSTGSATLGSLAKNKIAALTLGTFTPSTNGTYTVTATAADPVTLVASPKSIVVAPFAGASLTVVPIRIPTSLPLAQGHTRVSRTNTINVADDPLFALIRTHVQQGADFESAVLVSPDQNLCFKCHIHAQGMIGLESARNFSGVTVNETASRTVFDRIIATRGSDGQLHVTGYPPDETSQLAGWGMSHWHDATEALRYLISLVEVTLTRQSADGSWNNGGGSGQLAYGKTESWTLASVDQLGTAYKLTGDPRYLASVIRGGRWLLAYNYSAVPANESEKIARVAIGLGYAMPYLPPDMTADAKLRLNSIASLLRSYQNVDGSFGVDLMTPPVLRTAQCLYAISLSGAPPSDPAIRAATVWLLNQQQPNGQFGTGSFAAMMDQTTWTMIALSGAWARVGQFDTDLHITLPDSTQLVSSSPTPTASVPITGGREYVWHLPGITDSGTDAFMTLRFNGLQNQETRAIATAASLTYKDPYSGLPVTRPVGIPSITGIAPVGLTVTTDQSSYGANANVSITETISDATAGLTNDVVIRDASAATVATLAANETIAGLPPAAFPGWRYSVAATLTPPAGASRNAVLSIDFAQQLALLGVTGTFDPNTIRVSADATPSEEMPFTWLGDRLTIQIRDDVGAGTALPIHIYFDTLENGIKPASLADRNVTAVGPGWLATYNPLDSNHMSFNTTDPANLAILQPPFLVNATRGSQMAQSLEANATRFFTAVFTGAFYVPATGTYQLLLGSAQGSWLDIDGIRVINNGGFHGIREITVSTTLTQGFHRVKITMYRWDNSAYDMYLKWAPPGKGFDLLPAQNLFLDVPFNGSLGAPVLLARGQTVRSYTWNTASTATGTYSAAATLRQNGAFAVSASAPFTIAGSAQITASVATDKALYDAGDTVHETATVQYATGNTPLANLTATTSILDPGGVAVSTRNSPIASLAPGQSVPLTFDWIAGTAAPGIYAASLVVKDAGGATLAQKSVPFTIRSTALSGRGISGSLSGPATVPQTQTINFGVSLTNGGNSAIADAAFAVQILDPATQQLIDSVPFHASIAIGATYTTQVPYATSTLHLQRYQATMISLISGAPVPLSSITFEVIAPTTVVTATVTTDKTSYDPGDTLHSTTTVNYVTGSTPLSGVTVTTTIGGISGTTTINSIAPGTSAVTTFDWPVGTTAPGTYSVSSVVKDANGNLLAQQSGSFTIASTAQTGKGITGTIVIPASIVRGSTLPITVAISDNGNAALADAPFAVKIAGDTLPFTATVALAGTTTKTLSYDTTALVPQTYTATLVSRITGQDVTLATTSFAVVPPTLFTAAVATDKSTYDPGDTLHATTTVNYVTGAAPLTNVTVTTTIVSASGTSTINSIAPGTSTTTTFDWPVGTTAPGNYTVIAVVKDASANVLAQASAPFTIASTAQTGKGITGTISTPATIVKGQALPITVTITNNGNAALTDAPLAVKIGSDTINFSAGVAMGATTTKQLSFDTSPLVPQTYTATLVSLVTGQAVTLGSASFAVTPPRVVTATIATDKPQYDAGDTVHVTTTLNYVSGGAPLSNITAATTIGTSSGTSTIASIAPGSSATVTFDWPAGTNPPGAYTVNVVVKDASGTILTQQSSSFTIISTAVSGKGISGTISVTASVTQGDALPIAVTIADNGNAAITDAPFAVEIASNRVPFTATVGLGSSTTRQLTYDTAVLAPATYTATLLSMITGQPVTLASTSFDVKPAITLSFAPSSSAPRALIWSDCSSNHLPCTPITPLFLTQTLTAAGIDWTLTGDEASFFTQLRTGAFSEAILVPPPTPELKAFAEFSETIRAGEGLLFVHDHPDAEPKLTAALGVTFGGKLNATSTLLDIVTTPFTTAGQMTVNGDGVKISLVTAQPVARIAATQAPAISLNNFAGGRVVVLPFSPEATATPDMARFIVNAAGYVSRAATTDARQIATLDIGIGVPAGGAQNVTVSLTLSSALQFVAASPQPSSGTTWNLTIPGGTTQHVNIRVRLPETIGTYDAAASVALSGQMPLVTRTVTLHVDADRAAIESALSSDLTALQANAGGTDLSAVTDAQNEFAALHAATDAVSAIAHILKIANDLASISIDTTTARRDADRLLLYWQSRS